MSDIIDVFMMCEYECVHSYSKGNILSGTAYCVCLVSITIYSDLFKWKQIVGCNSIFPLDRLLICVCAFCLSNYCTDWLTKNEEKPCPEGSLFYWYHVWLYTSELLSLSNILDTRNVTLLSCNYAELLFHSIIMSYYSSHVW